MSEVLFRRASEADLPAIVAMLADDILGRQRENLTDPLGDAYVKAFRAIDADPNQLLAVAVDGGRLVGTLQVTFLPGLSRQGAWRGQIEGVRVATGHRGAGLGRLMVAWAIEQCRARNCRVVQLTTDKSRVDAHRFYDRLGFKASHLGYKLEL